MPLHPGLKKFFINLSVASRKVEQRIQGREKLRSHIRKIRIISERTAKKSVIHEEIKQLEKHLEGVLDKRLGKPSGESLERVKQKEIELNSKIAKLNELLSKVGKKIDEGALKEQLEEETDQSSLIEQLEDKLYSLESRYNEMEKHPDSPKELLNKVKDKISDLKERIRELKPSS
jgi:DNA repair exonuclease SbcCD ATPase subunit